MKYSLFASRVVASLVMSTLIAPTTYSRAETVNDDDKNNSGDLFMKVDTKKSISINAKGEDASVVFGLYQWIGKTDAREDKLTDEQKKEGGWKKLRGKARRDNDGKKWLKKDALETGDRDPIKENGFTAIQVGDQKYYVAQPKDREQSLSIFDSHGKRLNNQEIENIENVESHAAELSLRETFLPTANTDPHSELAGTLYLEYQKRLTTEEIQFPGRIAGEKGPKLDVLADYAGLSETEIAGKCEELDKKLKSPAPYEKAKIPVTLSRLSKKEAAKDETVATNSDAAATLNNPFYPLQNIKDRRYDKPGKLKIRRAVKPKTKNEAYPADYIFIHSDKPEESEYEILDFPVDQATLDRFFPRPKNAVKDADGNRTLSAEWTLVDPATDTLFPRTSEEAFCFFRKQAKAAADPISEPSQTTTDTPLPAAPKPKGVTIDKNANSVEQFQGQLNEGLNVVGDLNNNKALAAPKPRPESGCSEAIKKLKPYSKIKSEYEAILIDPWFVKKANACKTATSSGSSVLGEKSAWTSKSISLLRQMFSDENAQRFLKCTSVPSTEDQVRACTANARFALTWNISTPGQFGSKTQSFIDGFGSSEQSCALFLSLKEKFEQMTSAAPEPSDFFRTAFIRKQAKADYLKLTGPGGACHVDHANRSNQSLKKEADGEAVLKDGTTDNNNAAGALKK